DATSACLPRHPAVAYLFLVRCSCTMPPAFWIVLTISLLVVLTSCGSCSRAASLFMSLLVPLVVTGLVLLLHKFFSYDEPHSPGWPLVGAILILVPSVAACAAAALICNWLKHRKSQE